MFVTAYPDYALDGYEVDARGYILKPFDSDKIAATFNRVFQNHPPRFYTLRTQSKIVTIPLYDIMYIESCNTMCTIHCNCNITYREYKKLSDIEQELNDNRFLRCHQSYLVNMDYIKSAGAEFLLDDGEVVAIRQKGIGEVKKRFYQYIRG
jgi:DNA-binding LytR/AlgR family response regulator